MPTLHLQIKGKVQGVFFRATAADVANDLNIKGWVKNTVDGNVEAVVSGTDDQLQQFVQWAKQGPERAKVTEVIVTESDEKVPDEFIVIR